MGRQPRRAVLVVSAVIVFCATAALAVAEAAHQGISIAENDYLDHIDGIEGWLRSVRAEGLSASVRPHDPARSIELQQSARNDDAPFWEARRAFNPHPPLFKFLALASRTVLSSWPFPRAERFPTALVFAGACTALFWTLSRRRGWVAGLVGAAALATMPRFVSFAGFCTPDVTIAAAWLWVAFAFERFEETRKWRWWVVAAAAFSFGLSSKLSMLPLMAPLGALTVWWRYKRGPGELLRGTVQLTAVLITGLAVLIVTYPFLWPAPFTRLLVMINETRTWGALIPFSAMFFGEIMPYTQLPWYFAITMILLVVPPLTLALALIGLLWTRVRDKLWQTAAVIVVFWLILELLPNTPKYDNERGMMALFPFLALLAGMGAGDLVSRAAARVRAQRRELLNAVAAGAVVTALTIELGGAHPFPLSYFSPLVGGASGAARLGFEPTYAMEVLNKTVLDDFQAELPAGAGLSVRPFPNTLLPFLERRRMLRADLKPNPDDGPYFILVYRHNTLREDRPVVLRHGRLIKSLQRDGVPLAELWYLPPAPGGRP